MLKVLELFAGIGACSKALTSLGIEHEIVDAVEIDKFAIKSFNAIHGTVFEPQDITKWDKKYYCPDCHKLLSEDEIAFNSLSLKYICYRCHARLEYPNVDLIMHGSPCQDFSIAGLGHGGDAGSGTRSSLMYETLRIVAKLMPKYVIWENVKNLLSAKHRHNFNAYLSAMKRLGYTNYYQVLNAKDYGVPQNRERIFTVSIFDGESYKFPEAEELSIKLKDILETKVDEKYYLKPEQLEKLKWKGKSASDNMEPKIINPQGRANKVCTARNYAPTLRAQTHGNEPLAITIKTANKKGYDEAILGDSVNLAYPDSKTRRGRVGHSVEQTLTTSDSMGVVESAIIDDTQGFDGARYYPGYSPTLRASRSGLKTIDKTYRIRKLTPKECWRLMGFSDEDFDKASKVNSNSQLYKQAGNSIVINVLRAILSNLLEEK